ncbi:MAG: hypothetical protein V1800_14020 [Candidatus Latescibacterota bacterium]
MNLHIRTSLHQGYNQIVGAEDARLTFIELGILRLSEGERYTPRGPRARKRR